MKKHPDANHMRREAEAAHGLLDATLVVEVRDARPLVRRSHGMCRRSCSTLASRASVARRLPCASSRSTPASNVFCTLKTPQRPAKRTAQRRLFIEIALDDIDAMARQRRRPLALRLARQAAQTEPAALQRRATAPP